MEPVLGRLDFAFHLGREFQGLVSFFAEVDAEGVAFYPIVNFVVDLEDFVDLVFDIYLEDDDGVADFVGPHIVDGEFGAGSGRNSFMYTGFNDFSVETP